MIKELKKGQTLLAQGPSRISILDGKVEVFSKLVDSKSPSDLVVQGGKQLPFFALENSKVEIYTNLSEEFFEIVDDNSIPKQWEEVKEELIEIIKNRSEKNRPTTILILGLSHGKTSLAIYLINNFLKEKLKGIYCDMDMGQQALYIPVCVSLTTIRDDVVSISDLKPEKISFIGATFPKGDLKFIVSHYCKDMINEYLENNNEIDFCMVDHDSWILNEPGVVYKSFFIETVKPDVIVVLYDKEIEEFDLILNKAKKSKILKIEEKNSYFFERDKDTRKFHRQSLFAKTFNTFQKTTIPLDEMKFVKKDYDSETDQVIEIELDVENLVTLPYHYTIVALLTEDSQLINVALLFTINIEKNYILLFTDISYKEQLMIDKIQIGQIRLSIKGNSQGVLFT